MKPYPLLLEISGPTAMWTRPDTGSSPVPYVAPTFSAVKGIFESVLRWKSVNVRPARVEICAPVQCHRYTTNYGGPLRASDAMNQGASCSLARRTGEGARRAGEGGIRPGLRRPIPPGSASAKSRTTNCPPCCDWYSTKL